jgi:type I restriction enzyme, S subunit
MAGEWQHATIGDIASKARNALVGGPFGSNLVSDDYVSHGIPVIRGQNMAGRWVSGEFAYVTTAKAASLEANLACPGDIVFTQRGTLGQVSIVPEGPFDRYLISQSQMKLTVDRNRADPLFIYYIFRTPVQQEYIRQHAIQTGVPHTNLGILRGTPVPLPPMHEQRAIAHVLGTLDDKIELNRRMNETLEAIARALFKSWFVDFDPVRAKAEGRDPNLPKHLADLFPDSFEESDVGEMPTGWDAATVAEVANINAQTLDRSDHLDVIDYVEISEVMRGEIGSVVRYERGTEPSRARRRLRHGDTVLLSVRPDRGAHFLCLDPPDTLIASTGFVVLSPRDGNWAFLYAALTRREVGEELGRLADGGAYPAVRPEAVARLLQVLPAKEAVGPYERLARPLFEQSARKRTESKILSALRDALLPKLISGELRVKAAEQIVGRTL